MKFKIVLFLSVLFFAAVGTQAQPDCREKVSPYNICNTDYAKADFIFYGEVLALDKEAIGKASVQVKKIFKGKVDGKIELYLDIDIMCQGIPPVGSSQIYNVNRTVVNGKTRYYSKYTSRPLTDYSPQALEEVFSDVQAVLNNKKKSSLDGIVFGRLTTSRNVVLKNEEADRYYLNLGSFKPAPNILIEAVSEQDKKVYRTKSKVDGTYEIENIPPGKYKLRAYLTTGTINETLEIAINGSPCTRRQYIILQKSE